MPGAGPGNPFRLYVLNRIDHSIATVEASTLTLLDTLPLHDPSSEDTRLGRRFLQLPVRVSIDAPEQATADIEQLRLEVDPDGKFASAMSHRLNLRGTS